jgi:hypothetical protein
MEGEHLGISLPVFESVGRDPLFARRGWRLGFARLVDHGAGAAAVSAAGRDWPGHGAVVSAVSGGPALAGCDA